MGQQVLHRGIPTAGTSLSLMKRLMYSHILYNCMAVGFEGGWFYKDNTLSPIGNIQKSAREWVKNFGQPGVQHTPVALLLDFDAGWLVPRSACYPVPYRVWGNLPYENGDYLTDDIANMFYPGYADSSFFHDESGFSTPTPYGDSLDCLLSDAPPWLLNRYGVIVVTGTNRGRELQDKLQAYVAAGGHLVLTGGAWIRQSGRGLVTVLPGTGLVEAGKAAPANSEDRRFESPRPLSPEAHAILDRIFNGQRLFEVDPRLGLITCRKKAGEYTLGVLNNSWGELPLSITSHCGQITSVQELAMNASERSAVGFMPQGLESARLGNSNAAAIAGGDIRIFSVRVKETGVEDLPHIATPPRPHNVILPLRKPVGSIKEEILRRPTFFQHFDGVIVDWRYLHDREKGILTEEAPWIKRQGLRVMVDLSSGLNLYPDLRLIDNDHEVYVASMAAISDVMEKMEILGSIDLVLSLNGLPENNFGGGWNGYDAGLKQLSVEAAKHGITLYLRMAPNKTPGDSPQDEQKMLARLGVTNFKVAAATAMTNSTVFDANTQSAIGLWLASSPMKDEATGSAWSIYGRLHGTPGAQHVRDLMAAVPAAPVVLDGVYENWDQEYLDATEVPGNAR